MGINELSSTRLAVAKTTANRWQIGGMILFLSVLLLWGTGCNSPGASSSNSAPIKAAPPAATMDKQVEAIKNNPNMPDAAKKQAIAAIQANSQGHY